MHLDCTDVQMPWLRNQLVEWLRRLSSREWQEKNWLPVAQAGVGFDDALDFFDDTGVLDEPSGRIGFILLNDREAVALEDLNRILDGAVSGRGMSDEEIIHSAGWADVVAAAQRALVVLGEDR
ncbi:SCO4402 family protein [Streptomyces sp. NPDC000878]